jgi:CheY-like chemotaxis protein
MSVPYILYVEDDEDDVFLLRHALRTSAVSAEIIHISTPQQFSAAMEHIKPDLILADSNVPGFDTKAALALARERCPAVPFIYLTGFTTEQRTAALVAAGAAGCMCKGDRTHVTSTIKRVLDSQRPANS